MNAMLSWIMDNALGVITATIAIIALFQPWIISNCVNSKVDIVRIPENLLIGFKREGIFLQADICLNSKNKKYNVYLMKAYIKDRGQIIYNCEWSHFWPRAKAQFIHLEENKPKAFTVDFFDSIYIDSVKKHIKDKNHRGLMDLFLLNKGSEYDIVFEITGDNNKPFMKTFKFALRDDDVESLSKSLKAFLDDTEKWSGRIPFKLEEK